MMKNYKLLSRLALISLVTILGVLPAWGQEGNGSSTHLYVPDGQLITRPIRVYVNRDLTESMCPTLSLSGVASRPCSTSKQTGEPSPTRLLVARNQSWTEEIGGQTAPHVGTMMLFDVSGLEKSRIKPMVRVTPVLTWTDTTESATTHTAVTATSLYLGRHWTAFFEAALTAVLLVIVIGLLLRREGRTVAGVLCNPDGTLSISRCQVAVWTVVVGFIVTGFAIMRLSVGIIPPSVVALMGMSVATGGLSHHWGFTRSRDKASVADSAAVPPELKGTLRGLVYQYNKELKGWYPSLPRSQMVFWTVLIVVIFVAKSLTDGQLWAIPWEIVGLMGISQGAYLAPKHPDRIPSPDSNNPDGGQSNAADG